VAVTADWICHRAIVNLKQSAPEHVAFQAPLGADVTISIRARPPALSRQESFPSPARNFPADARPRIEVASTLTGQWPAPASPRNPQAIV